MKKTIPAIVIGMALAGCVPTMSADEVASYSKKCEDHNGNVVLVKDTGGFVIRVRCEIDGNMYLQGDY